LNDKLFDVSRWEFLEFDNILVDFLRMHIKPLAADDFDFFSCRRFFEFFN
jgi:succinate dehydrogenase flavin-adding protein (antitoxin of CptAB toxin-antitoxin module)